jgi:hydrogenase-4 component E
MKTPLTALVIVLVVSNFYILSTSRLGALIRVAAFQGLVLGLLPFITQAQHFSQHTLILGIGGMALKGLIIPALLFRALRGVEAYREDKPLIGYTGSIALGILFAASSFWVGSAIPPSGLFPFPIMVSLAIFMAASGLFLIIARSQVLSQVVGYLILENSIFVFGISLSAEQSFLVEMGALLDLLVGVIIMGIVIYHINREFDSISTEELEALKE